MTESRLLILAIETPNTHISKALKHFDDAIDLAKSNHNAMVRQFEIDISSFYDMVDNHENKTGNKIKRREV